jgi:hypothetical protein
MLDSPDVRENHIPQVQMNPNNWRQSETGGRQRGQEVGFKCAAHCQVLGDAHTKKQDSMGFQKM